MMQIVSKYSFLIIVVIATKVCGQQDSYIFKNITAADGLSQHDVNSIAQDKEGFLWFGTNDGLNKYDGYSFTTFKPVGGREETIAGRIIQDIETDSYGNLWIASLDGGLIHYNSKKERFTNFNYIIPELGSYANRVAIGLDGVLWIQFRSKLYYAVIKKEVEDMVFHSIPDENLPNDGEALKRVYIKNGKIFYGNSQANFSIQYDKTSFLLENIVFQPEASTIYGIQKNGDDAEVWELQSESVLYKKRDKEFKLNVNITNEAAALDKTGALWCVVNNKLAVIFYKDGRLYQQPIDFELMDFLKLKNNSIKSIFLDKTGILWVGTNGGGVYKKTNTKFQFKHIIKNKTPNSLSGNKIRSFHEDQFNNLWIGTEGGGISFLSATNNKYDFFNAFSLSKSDNGISSKNVFSISENILDTNNSIIWFSTEDGGLNKLELNRNATPNTFRFEKYNKPSSDNSSIKTRAIHSILGEGEDRLWIGYYGVGLGLATWQDGKNTEFLFINSSNEKSQLSGKIIRDIYRDSFGILWLSTNNGLNKLNENSSDISKSTFASFKHDKNDKTSIASNYTLQLFESKDNTLWIGTFGGGLNKMLRSSDGSVIGFKRYNKQNSLFPDDVVNSITEDNRGMLWVGTNNGLVEFNPQTESYKTYDLNDFQNPEMSEISAIKRKNGDLVFGGINGINVFTPKPSEFKDSEPLIVLTELNVMYEPVKPLEKINGNVILENSITHTEHLYLNSSINNFSLGFSSLHFGNPSLNNYRYMLAGFDKEWIETTSEFRIANYTNIPAGDYVFYVYGSNENGTWSKVPAKLEITIYPPWYLSKVAIVFYVIFFIIALVLFGQYTVIDIRRKRELEFDRLEKEKEKELNSAKLEFFTNISHELRSPLTLILGPVEKLIDKIDSLNKEDRFMSYSTIQRNADYLLKLTNQLLDFRKLDEGKLKLTCSHINIINSLEKIIEQFYPLIDKKNISLKYKFPEKKVFAWVDINKLEKIIHNLLSNAVKFTHEKGRIEITFHEIKSSIKYPDGHVEISIHDNGKGIKPTDIKNIFTRFYQIENASKTNEGVGIGLSFSQSLANIHGGRIQVQSEPNVGSCFTLELPLGANHLTMEQMTDNQDFMYSDFKMSTNGGNQLKEEIVTYENGDKPLLLIIEDNFEINHYIASEMSKSYNVVSCLNGKSGLKVAQKKSPDIIISDIMMEGLDGIEVCKQIKNDIRTSHIPFILLSAKTTNESRVEGLEAGADVYLIKPFDMNVLKMQLVSLLKNRNRIHEEFKKSPFNLSVIDIADVDEQFINNVIKIIEDNLDNSSFTTKELADKIAMSRTAFFNKIKAITGLKPTEFVRNYRLEIAAQFLQKGFSVKESMHKTGFNTAGYFTQSFKTLYKVTPSEYTAKLKT